MKTLILLRHAKSSWKKPDLRDLDRPLNKRGKRDAPVMGKRLAKKKIKVDRLISSPAKRALVTANTVANEIGYPRSDIVVEEKLYTFDETGLLDVIQDLDNALDRVMLFGHNPAITDLVNSLAPSQIDNVPTCGVVELTFDVESWADVGETKAVQLEFDYPKKEET